MKSVLIIFSLLFGSLYAKAQNYPDVLSYFINGTPVNGVKIKTNLPFTNSSQMPTIIIEGFNFSTNEPTSLILNYYIYNNIFIRGKVSSSGTFNPPIYLAGENGKVVIFIDSRAYFLRFHVRAFAAGLSADNAASYTGWTTVDSTLSEGATATLLLPYQNRFSGDVYLPGNSIWNANGNIGIGTASPGSYKLAVEGMIGGRKIKVTQQATWADFVFQPDYELPSLRAVDNYIRDNKHLPGIPTAEEVRKDGLDLGEMNKLLLQKVEELTLYMIEMKKEIDQLKAPKK
jgi:hypothetical protein